jgi:predicted dehydrogenase
MNYRASVIGCGRVGCAFDDDPRRGYVSTHAGAYVRTPGIELVALCDVDREKLDRYGEKFAVRGRYTDALTMLRAEQPDIVSVCTWSDTHRELVRAAVEQGTKAIFCEKPIADSLEAADEMIRLCAERRVILMIDHQRRFDPFHRQLSAFFREGGLGRLRQITCYYTAGVANTGTHLFDLLRFYVGDVAWVQGRVSGIPAPNPADPNLDGWIGFTNGATAAIQACDVKDFSIFEICLLGTKGRMRVTASGFEVAFEESRESHRFAGYKELYPAPSPVQPKGQREFMLFGMAHLVDCLEHSRPPVSSGQDGRCALEIICALQESATEDGAVVHLPLAKTQVKIQSR